MPLWLGLSAIISKHTHIGRYHGERFGTDAVIAGVPFAVGGCFLAIVALMAIFLSPRGFLKFLDRVDPKNSSQSLATVTQSLATPAPAVYTPTSGVNVHCVQCHREIDSVWQFCPLCGADNRPPEHRPPVPAHTHNFSQGNHCLNCGNRQE